MAFEVGQRVALRMLGVGTITDLAGRAPSGEPRALASGEPAAFYVVAAARVTFVPIATAHELIRPLVSPEDARDLLEQLRADGIAPGEGLEGMTTPRSQAILGDGSPLEHALFLRELYALPELSYRQALAITVYEDIVLVEAAEVLGEDHAKLEAEMRERYPAFERRRLGPKTDGPTVVATPVRPFPRGIKTK